MDYNDEEHSEEDPYTADTDINISDNPYCADTDGKMSEEAYSADTDAGQMFVNIISQHNGLPEKRNIKSMNRKQKKKSQSKGDNVKQLLR